MSGLGWDEECRGWSGTWGGRIREAWGENDYQAFVTDTSAGAIMLSSNVISKSEEGFSINVFNYGTDYDAWGMDFVVF